MPDFDSGIFTDEGDWKPASWRSLPSVQLRTAPSQANLTTAFLLESTFSDTAAFCDVLPL